MDSVPLLDRPWPDDLDPAAVPFKGRTETVLRRAGFYDNPALFNTLTEAEVLGWWNAGVVTVADLRFTANRAIRQHIDDTNLRSQLNADLNAVAAEPWASRIWWHDARFKAHLPKVDATVHEIATKGSSGDRRSLWKHLGSLHDAVTRQAASSLPSAVAEYVAGISGQHGIRLEALLACSGLNGRHPISGVAAARMLGVTPARMYQIRDRLDYHRLRSQPAAGVWMPQISAAERDGWPDEFTGTGVAAIRAFFTSGTL